MAIFGRTELIISVSEAKFDEEADGKVHWQPNPQNPEDKRKTTIFSDQDFSPKKFFGIEK